MIEGHKDWLLDRMTWRLKAPMMKIVNMTLRKKITILKSLIEIRQMTLSDPKLDP